MSKKSNEMKLIRNVANIVKNYVEVNDDMLEAIIEKNNEKFNTIATEQSQDNFLGGILENYIAFQNELMDHISKENFSRINQMINEKKLIKTKTVMMPKRKVKVKPTLSKPGKLKSKKGKYNGWTKQENNRVRTLIKANKSTKEIFTEINTNRIDNNQTLRTKSSINSKVYRLRKEE